MGQPVVHFEITGKDPEALRHFFGDLFGWEYDTNSPVAPEVSEAGNYGFIYVEAGSETGGIPGGIGGGAGHNSYAIFYVGVPDVEAALKNAEKLGGKRIMGPAKNPNGKIGRAH